MKRSGEATSEPPKVVRTPSVLYIFTSKCASRHNGVHFSHIRTSKSGANMWCFVHFQLEMCFAPQRRALFRPSQLPKVVRRWCVLYILTWKCALRHNGVHFFDIATSKSGPDLVCFVHFDFKMCFAPQRRCTFLTSQLPKVVRSCCVLYNLTWKSASGHNGVRLFISHLASWLRTRRFSEPTFRPSGAPHHWKNTVFATFHLVAHLHLLSSYSFSSILLSSNLSLLSASSLLCFSSVHIVGSLTSKHLMACSGPIDLWFEQGLLEVWTCEKPACQGFAT